MTTSLATAQVQSSCQTETLQDTEGIAHLEFAERANSVVPGWHQVMQHTVQELDEPKFQRRRYCDTGATRICTSLFQTRHPQTQAEKLQLIQTQPSMILYIIEPLVLNFHSLGTAETLHAPAPHIAEICCTCDTQDTVNLSCKISLEV